MTKLNTTLFYCNIFCKVDLLLSMCAKKLFDSCSDEMQTFNAQCYASAVCVMALWPLSFRLSLFVTSPRSIKMVIGLHVTQTVLHGSLGL